MGLPPKLPQLQPSQRWEHNTRKADSKPRTNIAAIRAPNPQRNRTRVPNLVHTHNRPRETNQERQERCKSNRQLALVLIDGPVEHLASQFVEQEVLLENDGDPGADPVCHHREEVLEDGKEAVAACDGEDELW